MSRNYYAEINLHIVWHTKDSAPLLVPKVEAMIHHTLRGRCINTPGVFVHEVGGITTTGARSRTGWSGSHRCNLWLKPNREKPGKPGSTATHTATRNPP